MCPSRADGRKFDLSAPENVDGECAQCAARGRAGAGPRRLVEYGRRSRQAYIQQQTRRGACRQVRRCVEEDESLRETADPGRVACSPWGTAADGRLCAPASCPALNASFVSAVLSPLYLYDAPLLFGSLIRDTHGDHVAGVNRQNATVDIAPAAMGNNKEISLRLRRADREHNTWRHEGARMEATPTTLFRMLPTPGACTRPGSPSPRASPVTAIRPPRAVPPPPHTTYARREP
jgi:hypothetical protein